MENYFSRSTGKLLENEREISTRARKYVARSILENNYRVSIDFPLVSYSTGWFIIPCGFPSYVDELRKSLQIILSCVINFWRDKFKPLDYNDSHDIYIKFFFIDNQISKVQIKNDYLQNRLKKKLSYTFFLLLTEMCAFEKKLY